MRSVIALEVLPLLSLFLPQMHVLAHCLKTPIRNPQKFKNTLHLVLCHNNQVALERSYCHHSQVEVSKAQQLSAQLIERIVTRCSRCPNSSELPLSYCLSDTYCLHLFVFKHQKKSFCCSCSCDYTVEQILIPKMYKAVRNLIIYVLN